MKRFEQCKVTWVDCESKQKVMENALGFSITRSRSKIAGTGVFVSRGRVKKGSLVCMYPGMVNTILIPFQ